jgi:amino acid adenylation domain-containing protein
MAYLLWQYLTESAQRYPDRPAVAWGDTELTYRELDDLSTRFASLLAQHGVGSGKRVGLLLPKSPNAVIAILGTLKAGAAYVPVDPHAPAARAAFILRDCAVSVIVTTSDRADRLLEAALGFPSLEMIVLAESSSNDPASVQGLCFHSWRELESVDPRPPSISSIESDPAYLLYTSGSTGRPKGVVLTHRHALTFVEWGGETFAVDSRDRLSSHAPFHFDLSIFDIFVALRGGACVCLVPDDIAPFPSALAAWIENQRISVWYSVPSALIRLLLHGNVSRFEFSALRTILFAGEVFALKHLRQLIEALPHVDYYNLYGPTETNVCTYYRVPRPLPDHIASLSIGSACANTEVFALDEAGCRVGPGGEGELYVRGPALMSGYWGDGTKTAAVLCRNPLQPDFVELAYRTGDIVRLESDGNYTFLGRRDHMVKSRGYRIELGEIEHALHAHDGVREAVVVATPDEEIGARLTAVVAPHENRVVTDRELQAFCASRVPKYMVPETVIFIDALPRTSTGKADRVALAAMLTNGIEAIHS